MNEPQHKSRYAEKVASGRQMYGNGKQCCAHRITPAQLIANRNRVAEEQRRYIPPLMAWESDEHVEKPLGSGASRVTVSPGTGYRS